MEIFEPRNLEGVNIAEFCGSCGIIILITEKNVYIANAGNSKCIPINTKNGIIKDKINKEHTVNDENEIKRLKMTYGIIDTEDENDYTNEIKEKKEFNPANYCPLVTTRGFGDLQYKDNKLINIEDQYILVNPDIIEIPMEDLGYLIIGNYGSFGENSKNKMTINQVVAKYFLEKCNNENKKISEIIEEYFEQIIQEREKNKNEEENIINNMACIVIKFKHENNNNIIIEGENEIDKDNEKTIKNDKELNSKNSDKLNKYCK